MEKKIKRGNGFTLAELLITVAVIAVLIAIMLPVFGAARADAIQAKDAANIRSAYAEAVALAIAAQTYDRDGKVFVQLDISGLNIDKATSVAVAIGTAHNGGNIVISTKGAKGPAAEIEVDVSEVTLKLIGAEGSAL